MELLQRIWHIARAQWTFRAQSAEEYPPTLAGRSGATPGTGDARRQRHVEPDPEPAQDPVLAGYYANLETPYGSDLATVRSAWKRLLKRCHPDLHGGDPAKQELANQLTTELNRAYHGIEQSKEAGGSAGGQDYHP